MSFWFKSLSPVFFFNRKYLKKKPRYEISVTFFLNPEIVYLWHHFQFNHWDNPHKRTINLFSDNFIAPFDWISNLKCRRLNLLNFRSCHVCFSNFIYIWKSFLKYSEPHPLNRTTIATPYHTKGYIFQKGSEQDTE